MKTNQPGIRRTLGVLVILLFNTAAAPAADRNQALADAQAGRWEAAEAALEQFAAAEPADAPVCAALAQRRMAQKRAKEAVALAERAVAAAPERAELHSLLGRALSLRIGELAFIQQGFVAPKMLRAFKRSVELDANHVPGLIGLASYYLYSPAIAGGSYEKAETWALEVERRSPFDGAVLRAQIRERQEEWAQSAAFYAAAVALRPQAWLEVQRGRMLARAGEAAAARGAFEAALKLEADNAAAKAELEALAAAKPAEGRAG